MERKTSEEVHELLAQGWNYLDVRTPEEFELGHVPNAVNIAVKHGSLAGLHTNESFLALVCERFALDAPLAVGCKSGGRAKLALAQLQSAGFSRLALHSDGFDGERDAFGKRSGGWLHLGLPITRPE